MNHINHHGSAGPTRANSCGYHDGRGIEPGRLACQGVPTTTNSPPGSRASHPTPTQRSHEGLLHENGATHTARIFASFCLGWAKFERNIFHDEVSSIFANLAPQIGCGDHFRNPRYSHPRCNTALNGTSFSGTQPPLWSRMAALDLIS